MQQRLCTSLNLPSAVVTLTVCTRCPLPVQTGALCRWLPFRSEGTQNAATTRRGCYARRNIRIKTNEEWAIKISVLLLTRVNANPAADKVMKHWYDVISDGLFYASISGYLTTDWCHTHTFFCRVVLILSMLSDHLLLFQNGTSRLWFHKQELELKVFALRAQGFWRSAFEDRLRSECSSLPSPDFSTELLNSQMMMTFSCFDPCQCRPSDGLQHITV